MEVEDDGDNEEGVIVFNFPDDIEGEQVESMDFADLKKLYVVVGYNAITISKMYYY